MLTDFTKYRYSRYQTKLLSAGWEWEGLTACVIGGFENLKLRDEDDSDA